MLPSPQDSAPHPRIGVYICHCGINIANTVNVEELARFAQELPNVEVAKTYRFMCSSPGQTMIQDDIKELGLNRVVVASCSPLMHESTFHEAVYAAGINPFLFQMANIREQCSWVTESNEEATEKAKRLVAAAVSRVALHEPIEAMEVPVNPTALIVGGGIAGIEAALLIAEAGRQVYLVEKEPSIGGHMARLNKVFPTIDCSACILTPKMNDVGHHKNITLLTHSELVKVDGYIGNYTATIRTNPGFVDPEKCTACGDCEDVCPVTVPNEFNEGMNTRKAIYRQFPQAQPSTYVIDKQGVSNCRASCPAHINVQGYLGLTAVGKFDEAIALIRQEIPFPAVCGRVCFRPCETNCSRCDLDEPVSVNQVKRFLSDYEYRKGPAEIKPYPVLYKKRVAILGSGPAGLTAAWALAKRGISATVYEHRSEPGGMLRYGIPAYRLPKDILEREIDYIRKLGITIKTNQPIGEKLTVDNLFKEGFNAILVATGTWRSRRLNIPGEDLNGVEPAIDFLLHVNRGDDVKLSGKVVIIGGGDAAFDAARTARRIGAESVSILYRRSKNEIPASPDELKAAKQEGIRITYLTQPIQFIEKDGRLSTIKCVKMALGEPDESGRRRPVPIEGSEYTLKADYVLLAIGHYSDTSFLPSTVEVDKNGIIQADPITLMSTNSRVFASGDALLGPKTVIDAIATGKEVAESIQRFFDKKDLKEGRGAPWNPVEPRDISHISLARRTPVPLLDRATRINDFSEVEETLSEEKVRYEAARCLNCATCCECMLCVPVCQPDAIRHSEEEKLQAVDVGAIIVATGHQNFDATRDYPLGYGRYDNVITTAEFERLSASDGPTGGRILLKNGQEPKHVAIIHCVGSRNKNFNEHCSRVCCMVSLKTAFLCKEILGHDVKVTNSYIDMRTFGKGFEEFYNRLRDMDVHFIHGVPSEIHENPDKSLRFDVWDSGINQNLQVNPDLVVLSVGLEAREDSRDIQKILTMSRSTDQFFLEKHPKLAPVSTATDGIYLAGACQSPKDIPDTVAQAGAAAANVLSMFDKGVVEIDPTLAIVDSDKCSGCRICIDRCPYEAIALDEEKNTVKIQEALCKGCGICVAACPSSAITQRGYTDQQILIEIDTLLSDFGVGNV